jgi:adenylate cyclase
MPKKHRQLAAIVFTDIVGYSKLMREDEAKATEMRNRHRAIFDELTPKYGGKVLQYYGDGTLSIFQSAVGAVECSVEMQQAFQQAPSVPLRIGIHTGDITYSKEEVFGSGVNLASRIETACVPGGIFVSGKVYDDIKNHATLKTKRIGQLLFKGFTDYTELYALDCEGIVVPTDGDLSHLKENKAKVLSVNSAISADSGSSHFSFKKLPQMMIGAITILALFYIGNLFQQEEKSNFLVRSTLPDQIFLAVLPFSNFSENNENEYFSDGITEDILTTLSNIKSFRVISRTSVMQYKNTEKSIREIGKELNATHILEGSVRKSGNKIRVVAQLIDARDDTHLWAESYDREMTEIFELQSEVAREIAGTLKKELSPEDFQTIQRKPTENVQAYELYLQGRKYYSSYNKKDNDIAIQLFKDALEVDSNFAMAYAGLGDAYGQKANYRDGDKEILNIALQMSEKAISLDPNSSEGYKALGLSYQFRGDVEKSLESYYKAVEINPNNDMAISNIALINQDEGKMVEAIKWANKAMDLNPQNPMSFIRLSELYESVGLDDNAEYILAKGIATNPNNENLKFKLGDLELKMNQLEKVKEQAAGILKIKPQSPYTFVLLGRAAFLEEDYELAEEYFQKVQKLSKNRDASKYYEDMDMDLAFIDWKLKPEALFYPQVKEMLAHLQQTEEEYPDKQIQVMIASIYAAMKEEGMAIQYLNKAVKDGFLDYKKLENSPIFENLRGKKAFLKTVKEIRRNAEEIQKEISKEIS